MMAFFPTPYEDEILYSILARYHVRAGNMSHKATLLDAFSSKTATAIVDLPCNIRNLINNMPPASAFTTDEIIGKHTLFNFYTAFLPPERAKEIKSSMLGNRGGDIYSKAGIMAGSIMLNRFMKFCPKCAAEELTKYGEMYWHRFQQIPCIICPKHGTSLKDSSVLVSDFNKHKYTAANKANCNIEVEPAALSTNIVKHLLELTLDAKYLTDNSPPNREIDWFKTQYLELLKKKGYATVNGNLQRRKLLKDFIEFYSNELLEYLQSEINLYKETNWLTDMLYNRERTAHPIRHLLLIRFLEISVSDIFYKKFEYTPFGLGPWPCLNIAADHYLKPVIYNVKVTYGVDNKEPIGNFSCSCGFVYTRSGYDEGGESQYTYSKIKEFGCDWEQRLKEVVSMKLSLRETAKLMGADPATVKKYARKLGLETFWKERKDNESDNEIEECSEDKPDKADTKERYTNKWLSLQQKYPEKGKKELRLIDKGVYAWLYRNDKQWLDENSPLKKYVYVNRRVGWERRDQELLQKVKLTVQEMQADKKPKRTCVSSIGSSLGIRSLLQKHLDKLPATKAYIESVAETDKDFRIRRVMWAIKELEEEGQEVRAWRVMKKAGIRGEFGEKVKELLNEVDS